MRDRDLSQGGSRERGSFQTPGNPLTGRSVGSFGISEGNITGRKNKFKNPQIMCLTATPSGEVTQTLAPATSKRGLNKEARAALLREGTGPESPEDNLRELM